MLFGLALWLAPVAITSSARAQAAADAGVPAHAAAPDELPAGTANPSVTATPFLPKAMPAQALSETVRSRLKERRAAARPPAAVEEHAPPQAPLPSAAGRRPLSEEAVRRGEARRRMHSFETPEGVTVLSNTFMEMPAPARPVPAPALAATSAREGQTTLEPPPEITETRSLRALRSATDKRESDRGGFGWPVLALLGLCIVGGLGCFLRRRVLSA